MSKTIYVVSERSFEYNDEIYHLPGDGSGNKSGIPQIAFNTKEKAFLIRDENNLEWFKEVLPNPTNKRGWNQDLSSYTYDSYDEIFNDIPDELEVKITKDSIKIPDNFSEENYIKLMNLCNIDLPWIVSEVIYEET